MKNNYLNGCFALLFLIVISSASQAQGLVELKVLDTYEANMRVYDDGAAEIPAFDPSTSKLFITNAQDNAIDVVKILPNGTLEFVEQWDLLQAWAPGGGPNSVATKNGLVAVAVENDDKQANGAVIFYTTGGDVVKVVEVGALPDMVTFTPKGDRLLVANEGEPNDAYTIDPEGSVSVIKVSDFSVKTAEFPQWGTKFFQRRGIRIFGPNATPAQDFEPEYITVSDNGLFAWVVLQENNALAIMYVPNATFISIRSLGFKNHKKRGNELDASNRDEGINIRKWPVLGMYQPDAIQSFRAKNGRTYIVSANEGDSRDYEAFSEEERIADITLDPKAFPNAEELQKDENLGRLKITTTLGDKDGDGDFDKLYAYGARSFSIWSASGRLVFDSGNEFEKILADIDPDNFNSTNDESPSFDNRSDDKGPEPEGLAIGEIDGRTYAFIGLERVGGVMVYDITHPWRAEFVTYLNNRDFSAEFDEDNSAGFLNAKDLGPEGLVFISEKDSPTGGDLLVVTNEVSGTTSLYSVEEESMALMSMIANDLPEESLTVTQVNTYPNPVQEQLYVDLPVIAKGGEATIKIIDIRGTVLIEQASAGNSRVALDMTALESGIYVVKVQLPEETFVKRVFKQ